jgi:protein-S-isoprenylcysteine O-methyltransferase Ste14
MDFFDLFQLLYVGLFLVIFVARTISAILKGNNPFSLGVGKKGVHAVIELSLLVFLSIWVSEVFKYALGSSRHIPPGFLHQPLFASLPLQYAGAVINLLGMVIFICALRAFRESWRMGIDKRNPGDLITRGIFGLSRNPIFLFIDLYFWGTFMIYPTPFFLVMAVLTFGVLHYQILKEERFLREQYGDAYAAYAAKTGRYLTLLPRGE